MTEARRFSRREFLATASVLGLRASKTSSILTAAEVKNSTGQLDNNLQVVDLTDLDGRLPLEIKRSHQVLSQSEDWEHSTWKNPAWPRGGGDTVGYPSVVRNTCGPRPDNKYYLYYAHHDPRSGIGVSVSTKITGPFSKRVQVPGRNDNQVVPSFHASSKNPDDPSHNSSPWVLWNPERRLWFMYFHFFNHAHTATTNFQPTALATCADLASHKWTIHTGNVPATVPAWLPVLPTTSKKWANEASSYNSVHRLPDGRWLGFIRGTCNDGRPTQLGFATSRDGVTFEYFKQNPILHAGDGGGGRQGVYRPGFVGYLGLTRKKTPRYLVAWQESHPFDGDPRLIYGYTHDFKTITRDPRGHVKWEGSDGAISAWREKDRLFLFAGKQVHEVQLPIKTHD